MKRKKKEKKKGKKKKSFYDKLEQLLQKEDQLVEENDEQPELSPVPVPLDQVQSLTEEQRAIYLKCTTNINSSNLGRNYQTKVHQCVIGSAGSGKTYLESLIVQQLRYLFHTSSIVVLVPTGMASANVAGSEGIHAFLQLPPHFMPPIQCNAKKAYRYLLRKKPLLIQRVLGLRYLVFDEISMITAQLLDFLSELLGLVLCEKKYPFGGLQILAFGDPYQLPPVIKEHKKKALNKPIKKEDWKEKREKEDQLLREAYFFKSITFQELFALEDIVELSGSVRQQSDPAFFQFLTRLKRGDLQESDWQLLESRMIENIKELPSQQSFLQTNGQKWAPHLYCDNARVINCNQSLLKQTLLGLDEEKHSIVEPKNGTSVTVPWKPEYVKYYQQRLKIYKKLVKMRRDDVYGQSSHRLSHSIGKFVTEFGTPLYIINRLYTFFECFIGHMEKSKEEAIVELFQQFQKKIEKEGAFLYPGVMIVLMVNLDIKQGLHHGKIGTIMDICQKTGDPLVKWQNDPPNTSLYRLVRFTWTMGYAEGKIYYSHYPINYAWSATIHKYQGQTAHYGVVTDLSNVFVYGQAYSVLSRVKQSKDLQLEGMLKPKAKLCHPDVLTFVKSIEKAKQIVLARAHSKTRRKKQETQKTNLQKEREKAANQYFHKSTVLSLMRLK